MLARKSGTILKMPPQRLGHRSVRHVASPHRGHSFGAAGNMPAGNRDQPSVAQVVLDQPVGQMTPGEPVQATILGAELLLLPGVHLLNVERPAEFMEAVTGFLRKR